MRLALRPVLAAATLVVAASAGAHAQADSVFTVSTGGVNLLRLNNDGSFVVRGSAGEGTLPVTGEGVRMMWFPLKYAFRAGRVVTVSPSNEGTYWDDQHIGNGSVAFGQNNRAAGNNSTALGDNANASGERTLAFNGTASAMGAIALGNGAQATSDEAIAMGPSSIAGGLYSIVLGPSIANGNFGVAIGLQNSASGQFSVAIGKNARTANRQGSVVIGDGAASFSSDSIYATANNQFVVRGAGGIRMITSANANPANVGTRGQISGVEVAAGGGAWSSISDRNRKENFLALETGSVLTRLRSVPVTTWNYKTQDRSIRHIGPMAQDLHVAFGVGESNLLINSVDIDGINMAGVKELDARTVGQDSRISALEAENKELRAEAGELRAEARELRARLERLEARIGAANP